MSGYMLKLRARASSAINLVLIPKISIGIILILVYATCVMMKSVAGIPWAIIMLLFGIAMGILTIQLNQLDIYLIGFKWVGVIILSVAAAVSCYLDQGLSAAVGFSLSILALSPYTEYETARMLSIALASLLYIYYAARSEKTDKGLISGGLVAVLIYELLRVGLKVLLEFSEAAPRSLIVGMVRSISTDLLLMLVVFPLTVILLLRLGRS